MPGGMLTTTAGATLLAFDVLTLGMLLYLVLKV
jgi:hypothetical protein